MSLGRAGNLNTDNTYFNFWVRNDEEYVQKDAFFQEQRNDTILSNMEDFTLSVVRFKIPAQAIPLFLFEDFAYTFVWAISSDGGVTFTNPLPQTLTWDPAFQNTFTSKAYPYNRFVYYYWHMLALMNRTLSDMMLLALGTPAYVAVLGGVTQAPRIELNPPSNGPFMRFLLPITAPGGNVPFARQGQNGIYIFANPKLFSFIAGFNSKYFEGGANIGGTIVPNAVHQFEFLNKDFSPQVVLPALDGVAARNFLSVPQDYSCLHLWQTLSRILLTTDMPVQAESIGVSGENGLPFSQTLLTDFEIQPDERGTQREYIFFYPQGELRRYNFSSNGPLRKMSVRVYFQLQDLSLIPVQLPPGFEMTIKLQFQRRTSPDLLTFSS